MGSEPHADRGACAAERAARTADTLGRGETPVAVRGCLPAAAVAVDAEVHRFFAPHDPALTALNVQVSDGCAEVPHPLG
ncbi:hypothetical protein [Streptomyces spirodelae]|uniref:Uncharacterized protein n=1 Tax=Streptomyces spirodelae TaxID=2812904 RepID=A0ABS3WW18_9ACTN|nr:hypothetical protein [Streptomyces spirodelae]MBO8187041.1 hypothetical protein [Streptomyces spirodelae]